MPTSVKKAKYQQIAESLRSRLKSDEMKPGDRLPSFTQMYRDHGASVATMSRVYELLENEGLIERRGGSGVYVAEPDNRTATGKLGLVLHVDSPAHPYMVELLMGISREAKRNGLEILMLNEEEPITQWKVDAVILHCNVEEALQLDLPADLPRVLLFHHSSEFTCVMPDDFEGARLATRHLLDLGHQRIACLLRSKQDFFSRQRLAGYHAAHEEAGIAVNENYVKFLTKALHQNYRESGTVTMRAWLQEDWRNLGCTAMLAHNDGTAIGVMKVLAEAGLHIPRDVSIIGFDGTEISEFCSPRLTTVKVPLEEIGARAVKVLLTQIREGVGAPEKIVLPVHLKAGDSTAALEPEYQEEKKGELCSV